MVGLVRGCANRATAKVDPTANLPALKTMHADFKAAIEKSIIQTKVFKSVVQGKDADYDLAVSIVQLDKPVFGLTFTVNMEAAWALIKQSDKSVVMKKSIKSSHTTGFGEAAVVVTRLRLAVEGAVKKNIEQGLQEIAALNL